MIVVFTAEAEAGLETIGDFIELDNPATGRDLYRRIAAALPRHCRDAPGLSLLPRHEERGIRRRVHGRCLILYREEPGRILILHILHGAMDLDALI